MPDLKGNTPRRVELIGRLERKYGLPRGSLWGVYGAETDFGRNLSTSGAGAQGYFQFMPETARGMGVDPHNFASAAKGAARYLANYKERGYAGMLAAYNAGPAGNPNNPETQAYIPKVRDYARSAPFAGLGGGSGSVSRPGVRGGGAAPRRLGLPSVSVGQADASGLAAALGSGMRPGLPQVPSAGLIMPEGLPLPAGYRPVLTGGLPARQESPLRQALAQVAQSQVAEVTVRLPQMAPGGEPRPAGRGGRGGLEVPRNASEPIARAIQWAAKRVGTAETGTNSGPKISDWQRSISANLAGQPWCGVFVGKALQAAGLKVDARIAYVPYIREDAAAGRGPFERLVSSKEVRPGDVVGWGGRHTGLVTQVNKDGSFQTIEGNSSDAVSYRTYKKGQAGSDVFFARPRYRG